MADPAKDRLTARLLSTLVLVPPVLAAVYVGAPYFDGLVAAAALVLAWEWSRLCGAPGPWTGAAVVGTPLLAAVGTAALGRHDVALVILGVGFLAVSALPARRFAATRGDGGERYRPLWLAAGILYIGAPCVALEWLRANALLGRDTVLWLFALVWASDSGAYAFGRLIGGPRLAPSISPGKTWAGLLGGMACAGAAGAGMAILLGKAGIAPLGALGAALGTVAQAGDLAESWIKRRFGVKDASHIIPGHGGFLDRVDGLMAAAVVTALIGLAGHGTVLT